jgi:site-specific DNA-methyltransferase (adenine-specific)
VSVPYYQDEWVTIWHGDCREMLPGLVADVLISDPPYGMAYRSGWSGVEVAGDEDLSVRDAVLAAWAPRPAAVFGRWNLPRPEGTHARLIWDKGDWPGMGDLSFPWGPSDEEVYILGDGWVGTREGTILRRRRIGGNGLHPTEKPVDLMEQLVRKAPPGTVLDPFTGSGTTLVAARNLGRKAIGIEIEEGYCEIAAERCRQGVLAL